MSGFRLSQFLPYRLAVASERVSRRLAVDYGHSHGLSVAEWRILVHLQHGGEVSVRDIQVFTNLEKSRVSRAVSRLEAAGLVDKNLSVADARLVEIGLSDKGRAVLDELLPIASAVEAQLLEGVPPSDLQTFFSVLEHFHRVLDEDPLARSRPRPPFATDTGKGPAER